MPNGKENNNFSGVEAMVLLALGAVASYFLWPVAGVAMMKAPGAAGLLISRAAFLANPKLYFTLLRTASRRVRGCARMLPVSLQN
ncbi:hypothetical protein PR202_ga29250 [Eleusine coracana subsp. coracana]|uniref:Uncharacterized protein n=1 Tax=Eleusine coracana subsp. coracana TaxID=191504 RepID=A0AAV5DJ21_ELECO|nr:hypothetical protein PR202_ga29250 [Eleusine coracana subsp. coracana]